MPNPVKPLRVFFTPVAEAQSLDGYKKLRALISEEYAEAWLERLRTVLSEEAELLTLVDFNRPSVRLFKGHAGCYVLLFRVANGGSDVWQVVYERAATSSHPDSLCVIGLWRVSSGSKTRT